MNPLNARCARLFSSLSIALWTIPLRLIVGYGFMEHGYAKITRGPESFMHILDALGVPAPSLLAWATIVFELVAGLAVLLGLFIPLASVPMLVILIVAIFASSLVRLARAVRRLPRLNSSHGAIATFGYAQSLGCSRPGTL